MTQIAEPIVDAFVGHHHDVVVMSEQAVDLLIGKAVVERDERNARRRRAEQADRVSQTIGAHVDEVASVLER